MTTDTGYEVLTPPGWTLLESLMDGCSFRHKADGLTVIASYNREKDGKVWLHVSFSRRSRMPDYNDITRVKKEFIGDDKKAVMVFPEKKYHINLHPYCLHLFHCPEDDPLPEFSNGWSI